MKILLVVPEYPPDYGGGIVTFYRDLVPALRANGCEVQVLKGSAFIRGVPNYCQEGVEVSVLRNDLYEVWHGKFAKFSMFPELQSQLAAAFALHEQAAGLGSFDAVEVTDWGLLCRPGRLSGSGQVTVQMHGSCGQIALREPVAGREAEGLMTLLLEQSTLVNAAKVSTPSRSNARWWEEVLHREVSFIPPPFSSQSPSPSALRSGWLSFGRVQHWKGPEVACKAWARLGPEAPLLEWYGRDLAHGSSGLGTAAWLGKSYPAAWGKTIQWKKTVSPAEVRQKMFAAEVVVIPSLWDVFNLVAAEAMAAGCVVIVSDGAGAADLIEHGVTGFIFAAGDDEALAQIVGEVSKLTPEQKQIIGLAAQKTVAQQLSPHRVALEKIALYRKNIMPGIAQVSWVKDLLLSPKLSETASFLDAMPLRSLTPYVATRLVKKIIGAGFP